ncbi:MAG: hypothetical protein ACE5OW_04750 [Candidatus Bathyarchaeia archaeon]
MEELRIVKMSFVGYGITEEAAMTKFWRIVQSYKAEHQLKCLEAEIIELGKNAHGLNSKYAAGYGFFSKLRK